MLLDCEKNENKQKEAGNWLILKRVLKSNLWNCGLIGFVISVDSDNRKSGLESPRVHDGLHSYRSGIVKLMRFINKKEMGWQNSRVV